MENKQTKSTDGETKPVEETQGTDSPKESETESIDYKRKFSESTAEAQRLLEESKKKDLELSLLREKLKKVSELEEISNASIDDYLYYYKQNPTQEKSIIDDVKLKREISELKKNQEIQLREFNLNQFLSKNKDAVPFKDNLRELSENNPNVSFKDLWERHFLPAINFGRDFASKKLDIKKKSQVESGKGSGEETQELTIAQFKKLSVDKQRKYLKERGL